MFSQRKSFFRGKLFYVLLVGLFAFGVWINNGQVHLKNSEGISTDSKQPVSSSEKNKEASVNKKNSNDILDNIISNQNNKITNDAIGETNLDENSIDAQTVEKQAKEQYLVKEVDGVIKVYHYDSNGKEKLIKTTDIDYSFLTKEDQKLFKKGIVKNSQEELDELLQDFES